ncbi:MAG: Exodeoxyribonuclease 7 large subunit [Candidatus Saccharibacteria bacterium]|nr:Exodeoxyribonuclease 7 large subunit [Candidatus Saccharibacteria bacterium]
MLDGLYDQGRAEVAVSVSEFVDMANQAFDYAFMGIIISGELANLRVSKNKWVYFDLKDDSASVKFFGTVYQLPGPLEDGMLLNVRGTPHMHQLYGFSISVQSISLAGEGTIRRAAELLQAKLQAEGLFDSARKRALPYPPKVIGLVTSGQSAAYADFIKILKARWGGLEIRLIDVQVQGDVAPSQIVSAIAQHNAEASPPDVIAVIRGGGSADDLAAFSSEQVTRAVAASRIPTIVAIGHEVDLSLAELAADMRASTPSNAAELLVPDRASVVAQLVDARRQLEMQGLAAIRAARKQLQYEVQGLSEATNRIVHTSQSSLVSDRQLLELLNPAAVLRRGYAIVRHNGAALRNATGLGKNDGLQIQLDGDAITAVVVTVTQHASVKKG